MSTATTFRPIQVGTCSKCEEPIMQNYEGVLEGARAFQLHAKFCTPKKNRAQPVEREHAPSSPSMLQSYTGRMALKQMERLISDRRRQAHEDARAIDVLANEGGRP